MSRKNRAPKREVLADPLYNSKIVTRLINRVMLDGKRGTAATIVYDAFEQIKEATGNDALEVFETAMDNIMPVLEVRARRVGGSNYQVPVEVRPERRITLGLRWLVNASRARGEHTMKERLAKEEKRLNGEIKRCEGMLGNERFVSKAPEAKVQEEKDKLAKYQQMLEQVKEQIARIS